MHESAAPYCIHIIYTCVLYVTSYNASKLQFYIVCTLYALYLSIICFKNKGCSTLFNKFENIVYFYAEINPEHTTHDGITVVASSQNRQLPSAMSNGRGLSKSRRSIALSSIADGNCLRKRNRVKGPLVIEGSKYAWMVRSVRQLLLFRECPCVVF